jgi:hypothetical protein
MAPKIGAQIQHTPVPGATILSSNSNAMVSKTHMPPCHNAIIGSSNEITLKVFSDTDFNGIEA